MVLQSLESSVFGIFLLEPLPLEPVQVVVGPAVEVAFEYSDHRRWRGRGAGIPPAGFFEELLERIGNRPHGCDCITVRRKPPALDTR